MVWRYLYAVVGIPLILVLGGVGVIIPPLIAYFLPNFSLTKKYYFTFFNGLAAGLILAVAFVHSLPDGAEGFDNIVSILYDASGSSHDCNSTSNGTSSAASSSDGPSGPATYAWFGFIAMMGALFTFLSEEIVDSISEAFGIWNPHGHGPGGHGHAHGMNNVRIAETPGMHESEEGCDEVVAPNKAVSKNEDEENEDNQSEAGDKEKEENGDEKKAKELNQGHVLKPLTKMMILFIGLILHNIFVGIALGVSDDLALFIAILFHQFFEGLGMGARVALAKLKRILVILLIDTIFAFACPIGIVIGIIIRLKTNPKGLAFYACDGTFQSLSGGILIYISIMHLLKSYNETECKGRQLQIHKWTSFVGLLIGATIMSVIGIWA